MSNDSSSLDWRDEETLRELIEEDGNTFPEVAEMFSDQGATRLAVASRAQELGLESPRWGPRYDTNRVPISQNEEDAAAHAIPLHIVEKMDFDAETTVRFVPDLVGGQIEMVLVSGVPTQQYESGSYAGIYSNERRLTDRGGYNLTLRYPNQLASHLGLDKHVEREEDEVNWEDVGDITLKGTRTGRDAMFNIIDENRLSIRYNPPLQPWTPSDPSDDAAHLQRYLKPITPMKGADLEFQPEDVEKYRFDIALDWIQAYDIEVGQKVAVRYASVDGEPAIGIDVSDAPESESGAHIRRVQHYEAGRYSADRGREVSTDQLCLYPGQAILHAHNIGVGTARPMVKVVPRKDCIALQRVAEDADGNALDIDVLEPDLGIDG